MADNPYASPQAAYEATTPEQRLVRVTPGMFIFIPLGVILIAMGCFAAVSIIRQTRIPLEVLMAITLCAALLIVLGLLLIAHGFLRRDGTAKMTAFVLLTTVITGVLASIIL